MPFCCTFVGSLVLDRKPESFDDSFLPVDTCTSLSGIDSSVESKALEVSTTGEGLGLGLVGGVEGVASATACSGFCGVAKEF